MRKTKESECIKRLKSEWKQEVQKDKTVDSFFEWVYAKEEFKHLVLPSNARILDDASTCVPCKNPTEKRCPNCKETRCTFHMPLRHIDITCLPCLLSKKSCLTCLREYQQDKDYCEIGPVEYECNFCHAPFCDFHGDIQDYECCWNCLCRKKLIKRWAIAEKKEIDNDESIAFDPRLVDRFPEILERLREQYAIDIEDLKNPDISVEFNEEEADKIYNDIHKDDE